MKMNYEKFPTKSEEKLVPPNEKPEVTRRKTALMEDLKEGKLDEISTNERPTVVDFQGLPEGSTEEDFLKWIEREINIPPEIVLHKNREISAPEYRLLEHAYKEAKIFLKDTLKYSDKDVSIGPESISTSKDIFKLLENTVLAKEKRRGLSRAPQYCRLVKATVVAYETLKHDAELLKETTDHFEQSIISPVSKIENSMAPLVFLTESNKKINFYANADGTITGTITFRDKDIPKVMLRYLTRAESNAAAALKDGVACRITIQKKDALKLAPILCKWLSEKMDVDFVRITNQSSFLSKEERDQLEISLRELSVNNFDFRINENVGDPTSMGNYKSLKILGIIDTLGIKRVKKMQSALSKQFEIQMVTPENKNERGKMHHSVYDVVKLVTARTRLDGGCPALVFEEFVREASMESGISIQNMHKYLLEAKNAPILKIYKKNTKGRISGSPSYVAYSVYARWDGFGWVDDSLMGNITKAKDRQSNS